MSYSIISSPFILESRSFWGAPSPSTNIYKYAVVLYAKRLIRSLLHNLLLPEDVIEQNLLPVHPTRDVDKAQQLGEGGEESN